MSTRKHRPAPGPDAPGLLMDQARLDLLSQWAYQVGHLHAVRLLDDVVRFRERHEQAHPGQSSDEVAKAVLEGFADTLAPILSRVLLAGLATAAEELMHRDPPQRRARR